jgi:hypothetical protein
MGRVTTTCGITSVTYEDICAYTCSCIPRKGCHWDVSCPNATGGFTTTSGSGHVETPPRFPTTTVSGPLGAIAHNLELQWERPVTVPPGLGEKIIPLKTIEGSHEEVAGALGLKVSP